MSELQNVLHDLWTTEVIRRAKRLADVQSIYAEPFGIDRQQAHRLITRTRYSVYGDAQALGLRIDGHYLRGRML